MLKYEAHCKIVMVRSARNSFFFWNHFEQ